ncbi:unnamed protein product [Bursaphelenchus okinawaensis]|uniref:C2H2-type domain-containing protein n=1 Tax=Bursaphelenchus okinawaensis TaxID=465554 RepID=A0A811LLU9_9BILA|nr:unnamed protein product [Bursaphelenchus okinawaensis]CAG9125707.1 unnamed protein product [Bursaphelenchus okinawaensis]
MNQNTESSSLVPSWGHDQLSQMALRGALQTPSSVALAPNPFSAATPAFTTSQLYQQMCFLQSQGSETSPSFDSTNNNMPKMDINANRTDSTSTHSDTKHDGQLGQNETAQLLLRFSQNLSRPPTASPATSSPCSTPSSPSKSQKRTFFRAPGLEAPTPAEAAESGVLVCQVCSFSCTSRFHYNSHMNTHGCHRCQVPSCNYTSRTEGRLKKHMMDSHTAEQRESVGYKAKERESNNNGDRLSNALEQMKQMAEVDGVATTSPDAASQRRPTVKPKKYNCKHCNHISTSKEERYMHSKLHIPIEKQLTCPQCDFVTEYKHHMTYHMKNHDGSKPFKCSKCEYTCVNKSMLNSHMKSHVPLYHYKCKNCTYQTKYCHSLKMHLEKYGHERAPGEIGTEEDEAVMLEDIDEAMETESMKNYDPPSSEPLHDSTPKDLSYSFTSKPDNTIHTPQPIRSNMIMQPMISQPQPNLNLQQLLLQSPEKIQELVRAVTASNMLHSHKCNHCDFTTLNVQELVQHNVQHMVYNQKQYTDILTLMVQQRQQQQQQQSLMQTEMLRNPVELKQDMLTVKNELSDLQVAAPAEPMESAECREDQYERHTSTNKSASPARESYDANQTEIVTSPLHEATSPSAESSASPSDSHKSLDNVSSRGSPNSSTTHSSNKKGSKVDKISQRLQRKTTPDFEDRISPNDTDRNSPYSQEPNPYMSDEEKSRFSVILSQLNTTNGPSQWPHTCNHCMVAFQDRALFQIHLGYHGYESPFKCNRCGHDANSSLEFNLHLYQAKH